IAVNPVGPFATVVKRREARLWIRLYFGQLYLSLRRRAGGAVAVVAFTGAIPMPSLRIQASTMGKRHMDPSTQYHHRENPEHHNPSPPQEGGDGTGFPPRWLLCDGGLV